MPIKLEIRDGLFISTMSGVVTDHEMLSYYRQSPLTAGQGRWRELVDGRAVTQIKITPAGQRALAVFFAGYVDVLSGGKVAMVASTDAVCELFKMWEARRDHLPYELQVFRDMKPAMEWLSDPGSRAPISRIKSEVPTAAPVPK